MIFFLQKEHVVKIFFLLWYTAIVSEHAEIFSMFFFFIGIQVINPYATKKL